MTFPEMDLLPADPQRGLSAAQLAEQLAEFDGHDYAFSMSSAVGAARLQQLVEQVEAVLAAGLGRDVAVLTLLGGFARLERDGLGESSDTVVRDSVRSALAGACAAAGVEDFDDDEINELALLLSLRGLDGLRRGYGQALADAAAAAPSS